MNALSPTAPNAANLNLAVQNADVIRALAGAAVPASFSWLAERTGRDPSNLRKTVAALEREGWATKEPLAVTPGGLALVPRLDVLEGLTEAPAGDVVELLHGQIVPDELNPRQDFESDDAAAGLDQLRQDIVQNGLLQNLLVRPMGETRQFQPDGRALPYGHYHAKARALPLYRLVSGERRHRAIGEAIVDADWPADRRILCRVVDGDDLQHRLLALAENLQRRALSPIEEAKAFKGLRDLDLSTQDIADKISQTARQVQMRLQLLNLPEADQARMELPKEHTDHLSVAGARALLQTQRPIERADGEARPAPAVTPGQLDLEEVAPRPRIELAPMQSLVLHEIALAIEREADTKRPLGRPAVKVSGQVDPQKKANLDLLKLIGEGFIAITGQYPAYVTILAAGDAWLNSGPGCFMPLDFKVRAARKAINCTDEKITDLERDEDYVTEFLNAGKATKHPRPAAADALIGIELLASHARQKRQDYQGADISVEPANVDDLVSRDILARKPTADYSSGILSAMLDWTFKEALGQHWSNLDTAEARDQAAAALRAELGLPKQGSGKYSTSWLNGPFKPSPEWLSEKEKRETENAAREQRDRESRQAMQDLRDRLTQAIDSFEREAPTMTAEAIQARYRVLLESANAPAPWGFGVREQWSCKAKASNGAMVDFGGAASPICYRLQLLGVAIAAGVSAAEWVPTTEATEPETGEEKVGPDLERPDFVAAIAKRLVELVRCPDAHAAAIAERVLSDYLEDVGNGVIDFGDPKYSWDEETATIMAEEHFDNLEAGA